MPYAAEQLPHHIAQARGGYLGLAALFSMVDEGAWASVARPSAKNIAQLLFLVTGKLDSGLQDLGYETDDDTPPKLQA